MSEGVDYLGVGPSPAALVAAGKRFTLGYIDRPDSGLTRAAIDARHAVGLDVGLIAEWGPMRMGAGAPAGRLDGARAKAALDALGAPAGTAVYFAADWDVARSQYAAVEAYLEAAKVGLGPYRAGLYGGLDVVSHVRAAGTVGLFWQTYAWSLGQWAPGCALQQYSNSEAIGGAAVDFDRALVDDWGQWRATPMRTFTITGHSGTVTVKDGPNYSAIPLDGSTLVKVAARAALGVGLPIKLDKPYDSAAGDRASSYLVVVGGKDCAVLASDATFASPPPAPVVVTLSIPDRPPRTVTL